jgi:hypothetical protein
MDTATPNSNHFASGAVDIVQDGAASVDRAAEERSGSTTFTISIDQVRHAR